MNLINPTNQTDTNINTMIPKSTMYTQTDTIPKSTMYTQTDTIPKSAMYTQTDTIPKSTMYTQTDTIPKSTMYTQTKHDNNTQTIGTYPDNLPVYQSNYARSLQNVPIEHMQIQPIGYTQNRSIEFIPAATIQQRSNQLIEHMQTNAQIEQTNNQVSPNPSTQQRSIEQIQIQPITHTQIQPIAHTQIQPIAHTQNQPITHKQIQPLSLIHI